MTRTLLIYYGQRESVAGVTLPWTREDILQGVSLPPAETQLGTGADNLHLGSGEGVLKGQVITVQCGFRGYRQEVY